MMNDESRIKSDARAAWVILWLLTIFAGAIRFFRISYPPVWYDESMVFRRTCGSYGQLLDCLRTDGFVPLHYSFVWVISHWFKLTPVTLRFFPALCGTLMVPAIYFLARQMLPRRTSLLAAAFTACSAFMLFYSRDAKMYMESWLFITLNAACLLWWFRCGKSTAWLCWIATGCAACGLQMLSVIPLAVSLLLLFTQRTMRWQQMVLWLIGSALILSGPIGYYGKFNLWKDRVEQDGWERSGLDWINAYNYGRTGPQLVRLLGTSTVMGWEWPKDADIPEIVPSSRVVWPQRGAETLLVIFIASCLPWPRRWQGSVCNEHLIPETPVLRYADEPGLMSIASNPALGRSSEPASPEPQWRVALWLSFWIVIPAYGFYCRSMPEFASPLDWWHCTLESFPFLLLPATYHWLWYLIGLLIAAIAGLTAYYRQIRSMVLRGLQLLVVAAVLIGLCQAMSMAMKSLSQSATKPWKSMWVPRYIGFIWPMLAVAAAALLMRLPTKPLRVAAILFVLGLNLGIAAYRILGQTEPPVDLMAADAFTAENQANHTVLWTQLRESQESPGGQNLYGEPGEYYLELLENKPTDPVTFRASLLARRRKARRWRWFPWDDPIPADANRIILWSQHDADEQSIAPESPAPGWKLQSEETFAARDCWIWKNLARYERSVYVKL